MHMLTNAKKAELRLNRNLIAVATRVDGNMWDICNPNGDRKDRMSEGDLLRWIATNSMAVTITEEMPQEVVLPVRVDLGDSLAQLKELEETLERVIVAAMLARQVGVVMGVDLAEGTDMTAVFSVKADQTIVSSPNPWELSNAKSVSINGKMWKRPTPGVFFDSGVWEDGARDEAGICEIATGSIAKIEYFTVREQYDYAAYKYTETCNDVQKLGELVTNKEADTAMVRERYSAAYDLRDKQYAQLQKLHAEL